MAKKVQEMSKEELSDMSVGELVMSHKLSEEELKDINKIGNEDFENLARSDYKTEEVKDKEEFDKQKLNENYLTIIDVLREFIDMREDYYPLIATWIIGTYIYEEFETYPYLFLNAMRGSGKTRTLKLISRLANNGEILSSIREAVLFRTAKGRTICIDEFEGLMGKENQALRELLNAAYKKGNKVKRMKKVKEDYEVEEFEVYTPICMANIWGMEEVLGDRCIQLILEKSNDPIKTKLIENFDRDKRILAIKANFKAIQCSLCSVVTEKNMHLDWNNYLLGKRETTLNTHTTTTTTTTQTTQLTTKRRDFFDKIINSEIQGRNLEVALPLLTIAYILGNKHFENLLKIVIEIVEERKLEEMTESKDVQLIDYVSQVDSLGNFIAVAKITHEFRDYLNLSEKEEYWLNSKWLGRALKRLALTKKKRRTHRGIEVILDVDKAKEKLKIFK